MNRAADVTETRSSARSAHWVAAGILLSRIAGLVRESVFANFFGMSAVADAWRVALRVPNVLQNLLGEGVLSASFIPVYAELLEEGRTEEAGRVAGAILALLVAVAGAVSLLGIAAAPWLVNVIALGFEGARYDLSVSLLRITFPMMGFLVVSAWALGVLNSHRRFFLSYVAPVAWNAAMVGAMLIFGGTFGQEDLVVVLAWGALLGGLLQLLVQLPGVLRVERDLRIRWATHLEGVRTAVRNAGPAVLGRGVVQISAYLDVVLASLLTVGAVSALGYAQTLYVLPISLFGMSVAAAELPELSRSRREAVAALRGRVNRGLIQIALFVVPSVIGYLALGRIVVGALFERGDFGPNETVLAYLILGGYALGLIASTATRLFSSAFFALHDTKTPAKFAFVRVTLAGGVGFVLMLQLEQFTVAGHALGAVGLSLASGFAAWVEWGLLRRTLRGRLGDVRFDRGALGRMLVAAIGSAGAALALEAVLPALGTLATALLVLPTYVIVYFGLCKLLDVKEVDAAIASVTRRVGG